MTTRKKALVTSALTMLFMLVSIPMAFAQGAEAADNYYSFAMWTALAAGIAIGVAAFGGALGQGRAVASALDGIARNPQASGKILVPMILGLALIESLVIYAWITSLTLIGKVDSDTLGAILKKAVGE